ncbi:hypothetical protein POTOM_005158 [Populus tomentosa]|uniref:Endoplasmic reticulum vesicle transporter protein n=1 Tax=Populus tomentosa TaxID=118781 RepID=A0A8X8AIN9_POPTO|nr:hypothetical protein POTOM_005158 [Populus tomentosa]
MEGIYQKLRNLDAYPKINEDFYSRTLSGGLITLISSILMLFLFFSEFSLYLHAVTETKLLVDTTRGQTLRINFDITFPAIRCSLLSVDAIDISGEQHHDIRHDITKKRINAHGDVIEVRQDGIGAPKIDKPLQRDGSRLEHNEEYCGSCFGGEMGNQVEEIIKEEELTTVAWVVCLVKGVADGIKGKQLKGLGRATLLASSGWVCLVDHWVRKNLNESFLQSLAVGIHMATYGESKSLLYNKNDKLMRSRGSDDHCCNSCEEVREAYRRKGWALTNMDLIDQVSSLDFTLENFHMYFILFLSKVRKEFVIVGADVSLIRTSSQGGGQEGKQRLGTEEEKPQTSECKREGFVQMIKDEEGEGCNINGSLEVNRVAGNFHFVPGKSFHQSNFQLLDLLDMQKESYNISHRINRLAFGDYFPGVVNPLDGIQLMHETPNGVQQFFIKVVPTIYTDIRGRTVHSNQYSVTEHFKKSELMRLDSLPGVYFIYDFSPIKVTFKEEHTSFLHFMTSICAIIGAQFVLLSDLKANSFLFTNAFSSLLCDAFSSICKLNQHWHLHYRGDSRFLYLSWSKSNQEENGNWQIQLTFSVASCDIFRLTMARGSLRDEIGQPL